MRRVLRMMVLLVYAFTLGCQHTSPKSEPEFTESESRDLAVIDESSFEEHEVEPLPSEEETETNFSSEKGPDIYTTESLVTESIDSGEDELPEETEWTGAEEEPEVTTEEVPDAVTESTPSEEQVESPVTETNVTPVENKDEVPLLQTHVYKPARVTPTRSRGSFLSSTRIVTTGPAGVYQRVAKKCMVVDKPDPGARELNSVGRGRLLWIEPVNEDWLVVYRKRRIAYLPSDCFELKVVRVEEPSASNTISEIVTPVAQAEPINNEGLVNEESHAEPTKETETAISTVEPLEPPQAPQPGTVVTVPSAGPGAVQSFLAGLIGALFIVCTFVFFRRAQKQRNSIYSSITMA